MLKLEVLENFTNDAILSYILEVEHYGRSWSIMEKPFSSDFEVETLQITASPGDLGVDT